MTERLWHTITRPVLSEQRLSLTSQGLVRYALKTPYRDGTTHVFFEPLDLMARLALITLVFFSCWYVPVVRSWPLAVARHDRTAERYLTTASEGIADVI